MPETIQDIPYVRNINLSGNVLHHLDGRFQVVLSLQRLHFCRNQLRVIDASIAETVTLQVIGVLCSNCFPVLFSLGAFHASDLGATPGS